MTKTPNRSRSIASSAGWPRIALIGCGAIAESYYLPALARHPCILESLILVDHDIERARKLAAAFDVKHCLADYREALNVDGAIIALPTHLHYPITMEFVSRGVHVLCEKPLASCASEAREMVEQAQNTGAVLAVDYLQRLWPQFAKVRELLANRSLGEPRAINYSVGEVFDWPTVSGFYFNAARSAGGVLRDRGAHVLDHICWWLGGKPKLITSQNDSLGGGEAVAYVRFEHGQCVGEVKLSWLSSFPCRFLVTCEAGTVEGNVYDFQSVVLKTVSASAKRVNLKSPEKSKSDVGYKIITNFIGVISQGEKPLIPGNEVLDSIQFTDECYAAATSFDMPWYGKIPEVQSVS